MGVSAGALLIGPSLEPCLGLGGKPDRYGLESLDCVGIVDFFTLSHSGYPMGEGQERHIMETYGSKYRIVPITDRQAIQVDGAKCEIVPSPQEIPPRDID